MSRLTAFAAVGVVVGFACAQDSPPAIIEAVAHVGDPAPGMPGFTLAAVGIPQIDAAGNVLFMGALEESGTGAPAGKALFFGPPGNVEKLIWASEPAPGMPLGVIIHDLLYTAESVSETGWIAFLAIVAGPTIEPGVNDEVLYVGPPGNFQKVLQAGDQAPGCEPGVYIQPEWFAGRLSDNGTLAVGADLGGEGIVDERAYWIGTRDNLELAYRDGMPAPGCDQGVVLTWADFVVHNDAGQIAFRGGLDGPGITSANHKGRWLGGPGALTKVVRKGDPVPGMGEGVTWAMVAGGATATNSVADVGEYGYMQGPGVSADNDCVLFAGNTDVLSLVAREGDPAPEAGPGVTVAGAFGNCLINNRTEMFYRVKLAGEGVTDDNQWAMYFGPFGAGRLELRDEDPAPSFPPDVTLRRIAAVPALAAMNDVGGIIAPTQIEGPGVTDDDRVVLWLRHRILERWVPLLRSGDDIAGRTVLAADEFDLIAAYWNQTGGADGQCQSLNDLGMLAILLDFTDGTHGVYRISPPPFADADQDGDVDITDWLAMEDCCTDSALVPHCDVFDLDGDDDVDLADQALFQRLFQGQVITEEGAEWRSGSAGQGGGYE